MSKEKILLRELPNESIIPDPPFTPKIRTGITYVYSAMEKYAQEKAIQFGQFISDNECYRLLGTDVWENNFDKRQYTIGQLYLIFKERQEKQTEQK